MQKKYNDLVVLVRNGVAVPAIVLKSQLAGPEGREVLSLLYADPSSGPTLVLAGNTRKVGSVEISAPPLTIGAGFGWTHLDGYEALDALRAHTDAVMAGEKVPELEFDEDELPGVHGHPQQADESETDKAARLANAAHQEAVKDGNLPPIVRASKPVPKDLSDIEEQSVQAVVGGQVPETPTDPIQPPGANTTSDPAATPTDPGTTPSTEPAE